MSASNSAAKRQQVLKFECYVDSQGLEAEIPFVEVRTCDGSFFPTTEGPGIEKLGGSRMNISKGVKRDSGIEAGGKVTVTMSRKAGSTKPYKIVSVEPVPVAPVSDEPVSVEPSSTAG